MVRSGVAHVAPPQVRRQHGKGRARQRGLRAGRDFRHRPSSDGAAGDPGDEFAALPFPVAADFDRAAVQVDDLLDHGQPDSQARSAAGGAAMGLGENIEHMGQQVGADASPGIAHADAEASRRSRQ